LRRSVDRRPSAIGPREIGEPADGRRHKVRRVAGEARQDAIEGCGVPYRQISRRLGIPAGSIGPTRARTLRKLADTGPVRALAS
jgi:hypothetical protein